MGGDGSRDGVGVGRCGLGRSRRPRTAGGSAAGTSADLPTPDDPCDTDAALRYVAGGDAVVLGAKKDQPKEEITASDRYSDQLLAERLQETPGPWCLYNTSENPTDTDTYAGGPAPTQQAKAHDLRPRLITLTLGRQNDTIVDHVDKC
ncbi:MAG: hypothetical protein GEU94_09275, partial [Micromonosporaceae bacterium]|nr:hypothetical protein [Micromonosporaceae bacterium]